VLSDDPATDRLPLKSTGARVNIAGVIAEVEVTQVYKNEGDNVLEAIYIFPVSTRAAVYAMKMIVGDRIIEAQIKKRQEAREEYEQARRQGQTASLLEQQRPNVFQMNVANILPGDEIKVQMRYTELLVPEDGTYEFVYPTVVGPRYSETPEKNAPDTEKWIKNPTLHEGQPAPYDFSLQASIRAGMPISKVASPSHDLHAEYDGKNTAHLSLKGTEGGNRDFVLRYRLAGRKIETGLLLYPGQKENFFLLMMEPPKRVGRRDIVSREYVFIVDVSGSMHGFPLKVAKNLMQKLLGNMRRDDYFNVLLFASSSAVLSEKSLRATRGNVDRGIGFIGRQSGGGGTRLLKGLQRALELPRRRNTSRIVVVITDGYVSVEKDAFELIKKSLGEANLFAFGIGSSVNRFLIEGMARAGMGEPFVVLDRKEAVRQADRFREYISTPLMQGIRVDYKGFDAYDIEPPALPDLFAQRPLILFGKYRGEPAGSIVVRGHVPGEKLAGSMALKDANLSADNRALRYLWARHRIREMADLNKLVRGRNKDAIEEITRLGLDYNLMTDYTSFVAVDTKVRTDGKSTKTVRQPLPMPKGVSDKAVGASRHSMYLKTAPSGAVYPEPRRRRKMAAKRASSQKLLDFDDEPAFANVTAEKSKREGLTNGQVLQVLRTHVAQFKACSRKYLSRSQGRVRVIAHITIGADGLVKKIKLDFKGKKLPELEKCLIRLFKGIRFPKGTGDFSMNLPLTLLPGDS
jgi:Ca-activated chloride channel family protein